MMEVNLSESIQVADYEKGKLTFTASFFEDGSVAGFKLAQ